MRLGKAKEAQGVRRSQNHTSATICLNYGEQPSRFCSGLGSSQDEGFLIIKPGKSRASLGKLVTLLSLRLLASAILTP